MQGRREGEDRGGEGGGDAISGCRERKKATKNFFKKKTKKSGGGGKGGLVWGDWGGLEKGDCGGKKKGKKRVTEDHNCLEEGSGGSTGRTGGRKKRRNRIWGFILYASVDSGIPGKSLKERNNHFTWLFLGAPEGEKKGGDKRKPLRRGRKVSIKKKSR